jgi:WD40 repeat protein
LAASLDGRYIALRGEAKTEIREVASGRRLLELEQVAVRKHLFAFAPNSKHFVYNSDDHTAQIRELPSGKRVNEFQRSTHFMRDMAFAPDGRSVAIAYNDSTIWMWNPLGKQP